MVDSQHPLAQIESGVARLPRHYRIRTRASAVMMNMVDTEVLIVGGGPVGLTASALLAASGIDAVTVTKHPSTSPNPRAHYVNQRTMEALRGLGLEERVQRVGTPVTRLGDTVWALSFAGRELARMPAWGTGPDRRGEYEASSPCGIWNVPQHALEPVLLASAREAGADIRFHAEATRIRQTADHVDVAITDHANGEDYRIRARYVIGADGARSTVAEQLGCHYERDTGVLNWAANVWLEADLAKYCEHRPGLLYFIHEPGAGFHSSTAWICVSPWREWVMALVLPSSRQEPVVDRDAVLKEAARMVGDPGVDIRLKAISPWSVGAGLADRYRRGRVFLAGDSAHRHPPPNGLGINTGIQDAVNLCWKLAMAVAGRAGEELLDSYERERKPVARKVIDRAMKSLADMDPLLTALGVGHGQDAGEGWARITELSDGGRTGQQRRAALRAALDLQNGQFNGHATELGQRYPAPGAGTEETGSVPDEGWPLRYESGSRIGHPLPHAWVEHDRVAMSTLDVVAPEGFTLITGLGGAGWTPAAGLAEAALGVPVRVARIDYHGEYHDVYGDWARVRDLDEAGCLLVRPDRFIAWRTEDPGDDAAQRLTGALRAILGTRP